MRKIILVVETLLLLSILTVTASAIIPVPSTENADTGMTRVPITEIDDIQITQTNFGPGSEVPWYDPIIKDNGNYLQGVWLSNVEPESVTWKFYDPLWHLVFTDTHEPSVKQKGPFTVDGKTWDWAYADYATFTIPFFPPLGNWWGMVEYTLINGQSHQGAYSYYVTINNGGSFVDNFFIAPVYFFGIKFPALFWCLGIIWIPGLILLILVVWGRGAVGAVKIVRAARDAARRARSEWRRGKKKKPEKAKKPQL